MRITTFFCLGLSLVLILNSCQSDINPANDPALQLIPASATSVSAIRLPQLLKKADIKNLKKLPIYQELVRRSSKDNVALGEVIQNPEDSGIDWNRTAYWFSELSTDNPEDMVQCLLIPLSDAKAFAQTLTAFENDIEYKKSYQQILARGNNYLVWNEENAIFAVASHNSAHIGAFLGKILNGELETVADNPDLQKALDNTYDISSWMNSNAVANYGDARLMLANMGFDPDALKDNYLHGYLNFEDGEVVGHSTFHLRKELTKDLDLLFKDAIDSNFETYLPAKDFQMGYTAALDIEGLNQVLAERAQTKSFINYALKSYEITLDDLTKSFDGDLFWGHYQAEGAKAHSIFATTINDSESFDSLITNAQKLGLLEEIDQNLYRVNTFGVPVSAGAGLSPITMLIAHGSLFISNAEEVLMQIKEGKLSKSEQLPDSFVKKMKENIFQGSFDFAQLPLSYGLVDEDTEFPMEKLDIQVDREQIDLKMKTDNPRENSLRSILWKLNEIYEAKQNGSDSDNI